MEIEQALRQRRSIRAYVPDPVPRPVLEEILDAARWSPSSTNAQAWHIAVVSGDARRELSRELVAASEVDIYGHPEIEAPEYLGVLRERRRTLGYKVYEAKGIAREDRPRRIWWAQEMLRFFGAPTALVLHTPKAMGAYILPDMGVIAMAIMLLAAARGLGTCPMIAPTGYPEVLKPRLGIPEEHWAVLALALGYPDLSDPVNSFARDREPLSRFVTWFE